MNDQSPTGNTSLNWKHILALLIFCCAGVRVTAGPPDIRILAEPEKRCLPGGEKLRLQVDFAMPDDRFLAGYMLGAYLPFVPTAFSAATGIQVRANPDPRWSSLAISGWKWLQGNQREPGKQLLEFDTASWPPGDYKLELRGLFRLREQHSVENDLYRSGYFYLTITAP